MLNPREQGDGVAVSKTSESKEERLCRMVKKQVGFTDTTGEAGGSWLVMHRLKCEKTGEWRSHTR